MVNDSVKKQRVKILEQLGGRLADEFARMFVGETISVLIEDEKNRSGTCQRYYRVNCETDWKVEKGQIIEGKAVGNGRSLAKTIKL